MDCSVIIPVYFNSGTLYSTFEKVKFVLSQNAHIGKYEILFIDDGSGDNSYNELLEIRKQNPGLIKIIKFTRNFGQIAAIMAGYQNSIGRCVVNISADMQDPPELISEMLTEYYERNTEIVICYRSDRNESTYRKFTSRFFYWVMRKLSFTSMPQGGFDFVLMGRNAINAICSTYESNTFWQGQILWTGYSTKFIPYTRLKREVGISRWTFTKKIKLFNI